MSKIAFFSESFDA